MESGGERKLVRLLGLVGIPNSTLNISSTWAADSKGINSFTATIGYTYAVAVLVKSGYNQIYDVTSVTGATILSQSSGVNWNYDGTTEDRRAAILHSYILKATATTVTFNTPNSQQTQSTWVTVQACRIG